MINSLFLDDLGKKNFIYTLYIIIIIFITDYCYY